MIENRLPTEDELAPERRPYWPYGAALDLMKCRDREVLVEGPVRTGKSRGLMEKAHIAAQNYPGCRILFLRQSRESMSESILQTWEDHVLEAGSVVAAGASRQTRQKYDYPNGSMVVIGGMVSHSKDAKAKFMSSEYDLICLFEGTECSQHDYEQLTTRLSNSVMPYQQIMVDCNPTFPAHWLNQRAIAGQMTRLLSRLEDNPRWFDHKRGEWTDLGRSYVEGLESSLTGARLARLRYGKWVAAEGTVFEHEWDPAIHVTDIVMSPDRVRYYVASMDWGYTNPGVLQVWGVDGDRRMQLVAEWYRQGCDAKWWDERIDRVKEEYVPVAWVPDPADAQRCDSLRRRGLPVVLPVKDIAYGIDECRRMMIQRDDHDRPYLQIWRECLREPDPVLREASACHATVQEFDQYLYPEKQDGRNAKETPIDEFNHGMDAMRYAVWYVRSRPKTTSSMKIRHRGPWAAQV